MIWYAGLRIASAVFFAYQYFPASETLESRYTSNNHSIFPVNDPLPESVIWSCILQVFYSSSTTNGPHQIITFDDRDDHDDDMIMVMTITDLLCIETHPFLRLSRPLYNSLQDPHHPEEPVKFRFAGSLSPQQLPSVWHSCS